MITIKTSAEIKKMKNAGKINAECHKLIEKNIVPGITTLELDKIAENFILSKNATPSFKGINNFPKSICTSINEEVVHGIPGNKKLKEGDIVSVDIGVCLNGYHSDSAKTYPVGKISKEKEYLLHHTEKSLYEGLKEIKDGVSLGTISATIEGYAKKHKLSVIKELCGHGIGTSLHEKPDIPNYGRRNTGLKLKTGMTLAIEPMLNLGTRKVWLKEDNWTIVTQDNKPSAHFEHTIVVTDDGYEILTGE